jgi:pimeloyl-ACP methyl ester carboxylesterase
MSNTNLISESHTHETVPTEFINVKGTKLAYRAFGKSTGIPIVFLQHFTGTLDNWDPAVTNQLATANSRAIFI